MSDNYTVVKIPKELIEEVDKIVGTHGYKTRPEFIKEAIRNHLKDLRKFQELDSLETP